MDVKTTQKVIANGSEGQEQAKNATVPVISLEPQIEPDPSSVVPEEGDPEEGDEDVDLSSDRAGGVSPTSTEEDEDTGDIERIVKLDNMPIAIIARCLRSKEKERDEEKKRVETAIEDTKKILSGICTYFASAKVSSKIILFKRCLVTETLKTGHKKNVMKRKIRIVTYAVFSPDHFKHHGAGLGIVRKLKDGGRAIVCFDPAVRGDQLEIESVAEWLFDENVILVEDREGLIDVSESTFDRNSDDGIKYVKVGGEKYEAASMFQSKSSTINMFEETVVEEKPAEDGADKDGEETPEEED